MPTYTQAHRPIALATPLGPDVLLITGFHGEEALSRPFHFQIDCIAESKTAIAFDKVLGQKVTVRLSLPDGKPRFFNGLCQRVSQGEQDEDFTAYRLDVVPLFWLLTKKAQSRIFQHMSVPDILKKVLQGLDVDYQIQGTFQPRNYCVQYRETDFNFASRLMEEEGIFYFFTHAADGHKMVVANTPQSHPDMPARNKITFEKVVGGLRKDDRIQHWEKAQELVSGKETLWDHTFEMPYDHLEAKRSLQDSAAVGKVTHKLKLGIEDALEIYDYPGEYSTRFDGVNAGGGDQPPEIKKIFQDNERTVAIRSQQDAALSVVIHGSSTCRQFVSGHKFTVEKHGPGDGEYVVTSLAHAATMGLDYRSGSTEEFQYSNHFTCLPSSIPFRPQRVTPKPVVQGTQTATVVGPPGEEIFCDKYGRVKVQFPWDRQGKKDANSSCWIRVGTIWAGKGWGITNVPRIGHEVIVDFLEGDPDRPIIIGSVHNADHMPTGTLPKGKMVSGLKSNSTPGGGGYNGLIFDDTKSKELISLHGQFDMSTVIEHDERVHIKHDRTETVDNNETIHIKNNRTETVDNNETITVNNNRTEKVIKNEEVSIGVNHTHNVGSNHTETVGMNMSLSVAIMKTETVGAASVETVGAAKATTVGAAYALTVGGAMNVAVGLASFEEVGKTKKITVADEFEMVCGSARIVLKKDGNITIEGKEILISASSHIKMQGDPIDLN